MPLPWPTGDILEVLQMIDCKERYFIEFGSAGINDNCELLWKKLGWSGLLIEGDPKRYELSKTHANGYSVKLTHAMITQGNINQLFKQAEVPNDIGVMSIDIDGMDYWIWKAIDTKYRPRLVMIEYNSYLGPDRLAVMPYADDYQWDQTSYMGSSLRSITNMANDKGYQLIGCDIWGTNAFYVPDEFFAKLQIADNSVKKLFSPWNSNGWNLAAGQGVYLEI